MDAGQAITKKYMDALYNCTCGTCGGRIITMAAKPTAAMLKEAERIAKGIYAGTIKAGTIDEKLVKLVAEYLTESVFKGFGKTFDDVDYLSSDFKKLLHLENDVYQFSAAKNYQQLKSMTEALMDGKGGIKPFTEFRNMAIDISNEYCGAWLQTEYDTAIGSAQMAGKWQYFEDNKNAVDLLRYETVGDSRVRKAHKQLDGVIRKVDDDFWNTYYPPNGFNCRCDVIPEVNGTETEKSKIITPDDVPTMFKTNLGKAGLAFPPKHPYFNGVPKKVLNKGMKMAPQRIK